LEAKESAPYPDDPFLIAAPNAETLEACRELNEGRGIRFESKEELFKFLDS
jgi:hypothetical protein